MRRLGFAALTVAIMSGGAFAQDDDDEEAAFDEALRNFGVTAGEAWGCSAEEARSEVEQNVLRAHAGVVRLFGLDRGFAFAAAFGAGAAVPIAPEDCPAQIAAFEDGLAAARMPE